MYYVLRKGDNIGDYRGQFSSEASARDLAQNLHAALGHEFIVFIVQTTWTTGAKQ